MTPAPAYDLCREADPYWLARINHFVLPIRLAASLPAAQRGAVMEAADRLRAHDMLGAERAISTVAPQGAAADGLILHLGAIVAASTGRIDAAVAAMRQNAANAPDCAEYRSNLGIALVRAGRIGEAVEAFEAAVRLDPGFGFAYAALALIHTLARSWPQAERAARAAIRLKARLGADLPHLCLMAATMEQGKPVEGAFDFASLGLEAAREIDAALAHLPPVDETAFRHPAPGEAIVFVACDAPYFWAHAVPLVWSMAASGHAGPIHLHIANPDARVPDALAALHARVPALAASFETVDVARYYGKGTYFSSARFCRLYQFLRVNRRPVLMVDADTLWRRDLMPYLAAVDPAADVALCRLPAQPPWARLVGRVSFYRPSAGGMAFLRRLALFIADNFRRNTARWFLDQIGLYAVHRTMGDETRFAYLPEAEVSDRTFADGAYLWTVTNELKSQDNRYTAYKLELLARFGDPGAGEERP